MNEGKVLVVFFSRTGTTRKVAEAIHRELGGESIEVLTAHYPPGPKGYLRAGLDATLGRAVPIKTKAAGAHSYALVIVGTPVWNASLSAPIRTYMVQSLPQARRVAFFLTHGGSGARRVFRQMETLSGKRPIATLEVRESEVHRRKYARKVESFVEALGKSRAPRAA